MEIMGVFLDPTWRIIPVSKYLVTPIYKPWSSAIWKGNNPILRGLKLSMVINHVSVRPGMILQVLPVSPSPTSPQTADSDR